MLDISKGVKYFMKKEQEQENKILDSLLDMLIEIAPSEDLKESGLLTKEAKDFRTFFDNVIKSLISSHISAEVYKEFRLLLAGMRERVKDFIDERHIKVDINIGD